MSDKSMLRALRGEAVWPPPLWLMRQAGRYLPEFRALRAQADFITRCMTPDIATEITLQPIRRFGMDGAILFSDILILPWAMGQSLEFVESVGPVLTPIRSRQELERLQPDRVPETTAPVMETLRRLRRELPPATTLIGFAGSPFTVACYMVEGGGSKEFAETRRMAYADPDLFGSLIDLLVGSTARMLCEQIESGAEAVMLFDSWSGLLPPSQFQRWVIEPTRRIVQSVRARHPHVPLIGFPRLAGTMLGGYVDSTGINGVGLDSAVNLEVAKDLVRPDVALQGNLDPFALLTGGKALTEQALAVREALRGRAHIFNLGHGVLPQTPPEHVAELVATVRQG